MFILQHMAEALDPLSREKEKLLTDYNDLKVKLSRELEGHIEQKRNHQQEVETLLKLNAKIKESV